MTMGCGASKQPAAARARAGVRRWGTSACSHEGGTVAVPLVSVFREAYDRTKPTEEGRASALRGRLQSVDPTKLNARSSEVALARCACPRAAGRAQRASLRLRSCQ